MLHKIQYHINGTRHAIKLILRLNVCPNNQSLKQFHHHKIGQSLPLCPLFECLLLLKIIPIQKKSLKSISIGHCTSFSAMFHPLHNVTNQEQYEKYLCNHFSCHGKYELTSTSCYQESTPCIVSKKK